jgi:tetratricopeptide (TPR) repeat protein
MKEHKDAITRFTQIINITPNLAIAYKGRGSAYYYEGLLDLAISDLEKSIFLDPNLGGSYMYIGMIYKDMGDINNAEKSITKAINLIHPIREEKEFLKATKQLEYIQSLQANP